MPQFSHHFIIDRPIEQVFDVATTARHWPAWHPATTGVAGAIDQPAQLGDQLVERVNIGGRSGEGTWTVIEYDRPHRLTLQSHTGLGEGRITYSLSEEPAGTRFQRDLSYAVDAPGLSAIMEEQSARAVANLKTFLEEAIRQV
jgi:uncharacterized protein YndB with AHSA1/START domain